MNLELIRTLCSDRPGGLKRLASDIGMTEANLHRCIKLNKIQASDLETAARLLNAPINVFFDESPDLTQITEYNRAQNPPASAPAESSFNLRKENASLKKEVEYLQSSIKDKETIISLLRSLLPQSTPIM